MTVHSMKNLNDTLIARSSHIATDLAIDLLELVDAVGKGDDLGRANEGEVQRVKEDHNVFAFVILSNQKNRAENPTKQLKMTLCWSSVLE